MRKNDFQFVPLIQIAKILQIRASEVMTNSAFPAFTFSVDKPAIVIICLSLKVCNLSVFLVVGFLVSPLIHRDN